MINMWAKETILFMKPCLRPVGQMHQCRLQLNWKYGGPEYGRWLVVVINKTLRHKIPSQFSLAITP